MNQRDFSSGKLRFADRLYPVPAKFAGSHTGRSLKDRPLPIGSFLRVGGANGRADVIPPLETGRGIVNPPRRPHPSGGLAVAPPRTNRPAVANAANSIYHPRHVIANPVGLRPANGGNQAGPTFGTNPQDRRHAGSVVQRPLTAVGNSPGVVGQPNHRGGANSNSAPIAGGISGTPNSGAGVDHRRAALPIRGYTPSSGPAPVHHSSPSPSYTQSALVHHSSPTPSYTPSTPVHHESAPVHHSSPTPSYTPPAPVHHESAPAHHAGGHPHH